MSSVLLLHHQGLGDHFMCHGIVREYAKKYDRVGIFSKPNNLTSVRFMFRDLPNIEIYSGMDEDARRHIFLNKFKLGKSRYQKVVIIGFENLNRESGEQLEKQFYRLAGVPFEKKWDSFYIDRDQSREQELYKKIIEQEPYIFVHDDSRYPIDNAKLPQQYLVVRPQKGLTDNIIDYCSVIEKAKEIHAIDSSFMFLIDCLQYQNPEQKLFVHRYARPDNAPWQLPILKKNWTIL